jgi:hypothetical protein
MPSFRCNCGLSKEGSLSDDIQTKLIEEFMDDHLRNHKSEMREFKPVIYRSFAEFCDREFRSGARTFVAASNEMAAFAEARFSAGIGWK